MEQYSRLQEKLARGWNTWDTHSVLSHVLLPQGLAISLGIKEYAGGSYLKNGLIGRMGKDDELIHPGAHAYDGSYTELNLKWKDIELNISTAAEGEDFVLLVTPLKNQRIPAALIVEAGILWNRPGWVSREDDAIVATLPGRRMSVFCTGQLTDEKNVPAQTPYFCLKLDGVVGISTGCSRTIEQISRMLERCRNRHAAVKLNYGALAEAYNVMQSSLAWDTIFEPSKGRVVTPVSRLWNIGWGGYVLFCWDTYFAAYMAAIDNKELAYANAVEITKEKTEQGFIPNFAADSGLKSRDRSQPPVGSLVIRELFRRYRETWLLEEVFDDLWEWNTWFYDHRQIEEGLFAWGSNPYEPLFGNHWEVEGVNDRFGGALESGLDNSPMYDDAAFNPETCLMLLADVGLTSLYAMDCLALSDIASVLGRQAEKELLLKRYEQCSHAAASLWDDSIGLYLNRDTDTGSASLRISPTNFYSLLGGFPTKKQAETMIRNHLLNPDEFWGEWVLPSISRNDAAYPDNSYWRGRIWAPMNLLVYLGLRKYSLAEEASLLALKSEKLILKEWLLHGHVHENYNADTGEGCDKENSDRFYHWGALLSLIALMEGGFIDGPEKPL